MTALVDSIWRYPVKAHGRERIAHAALTPDQCLPFDRLWAIAHSETDVDGSVWVRCSNFTRAAKAPGIHAITCSLNEDDETITFHHPNLGSITAHPEHDATAFLAWTAPLQPKNRAPSARVIRSQSRGMTDCELPSITLCNMASHKAVADKAKAPLSIHRWRGNIWLDGLAPWEEFDWVGKTLKIGTATLHVHERTTRCLATHANPETGERDVSVLDVLDHWGHRDFSVQATVTQAGDIKTGDTVKLV